MYFFSSIFQMPLSREFQDEIIQEILLDFRGSRKFEGMTEDHLNPRWFWANFIIWIFQIE